jgi:hypothetical protein
MRLGWDDVPDGVKSVLSGLSWLLASRVEKQSRAVVAELARQKRQSADGPTWRRVPLFQSLLITR